MWKDILGIVNSLLVIILAVSGFALLVTFLLAEEGNDLVNLANDLTFIKGFLVLSFAYTLHIFSRRKA